MEQFLRDVRVYAAARGIQPSTVIQRAKCGGGDKWARWETRKSSPTLNTVDRVYAYMAAHPAPEAAAEANEAAE